MHTLIVCLMIVAIVLIAGIVAIVISGHSVPAALPAALASSITGIIGVHIGQTATTGGKNVAP